MTEAWMSAPLLLAGVLAAAAATKWRARASLESAARELRVPGGLMRTVRRLPEVEVLLALGLLLAPSGAAAVGVAVLVLLLMLAYTAVVARGLTLRPRPSCACFGTVGSPIGLRTLARNVLLSAIAVVALVGALDGRSVPSAVGSMSGAGAAWLLALLVTAVLVAWIALDRSGEAPLESAVDEEDLDYVRRAIPPLMLRDGEAAVSLPDLARERAQLLVWVACGCARSHEAVALVAQWRARMPGVDVRMVSTMRADHTRQIFGEQEAWLHDPGGGALALLEVHADPVGLLLGADGLLAGGPVEGLEELTAFGDEIAAQLAG